MDENATKFLEQLAAQLGTTSEYIISEYARWHFTSAIVWIVAGVALTWFAVARWPWKPEEYADELERFFVHAMRAVAVVTGALLIGCHIPDLAFPEAVSIHQIIRDVRG